MTAIKEVDPCTLKEWLDSGKNICLIDVRQPEEHELTKLNPSTLIPLDQLQERVEEIRALVKARPGAPGEPEAVVVYCRSGGRSGQAIAWLQNHGFENLLNLRGGVNAYSREADPAIKAY